MKILAVMLAALAFAALGCQQQAFNAVNTGNSAAAGQTSAVANNSAPVETKKADPAPDTKQPDNSPKRISFARGANWGAVNITLAPGAAHKFIIGARKDQVMEVDVSSKETSVNLVRGRADTTEDLGFLRAELQADGDYVFEVGNSSKKEIKASVKVTIKDAEES